MEDGIWYLTRACGDPGKACPPIPPEDLDSLRAAVGQALGNAEFDFDDDNGIVLNCFAGVNTASVWFLPDNTAQGHRVFTMVKQPGHPASFTLDTTNPPQHPLPSHLLLPRRQVRSDGSASST